MLKQLTEEEKRLLGDSISKCITVGIRDVCTLLYEKWATNVQVYGWSKQTFDRVLESVNNPQDQETDKGVRLKRMINQTSTEA